MTKDAAAPAVILSFSLVVVPRIQGFSSRPRPCSPCRRISCTARDRSGGRSGPAALPWEIRCHCMRRIYVRPDSRVAFSFLNLSMGAVTGGRLDRLRPREDIDACCISQRQATPNGLRRRTIFGLRPPIFHRKRLTNQPKRRGWGEAAPRLCATRGGCDRKNPAIGLRELM
jgi:hypothetical protein